MDIKNIELRSPEEVLCILSAHITKLEAENEALRKDAERWNTLVELWLLSTELSLIQNEDGGYSIIQVEAVENITFKYLEGDTPEKTIDKAMNESKPNI